jgi:Mg-chelatase subunit ChlD
VVLLTGVSMPHAAQTNKRPQKPRATSEEAKPEPTPPSEPQDIDTVKTDTDLVTVPVIATDLNGTYIPDLQQQDFTISEDGVKQEIAFFGTVSAPFNVVLMLDTSSSTREKLRGIQQAASAFVDELQPADRVKVMSFDDEIKDHNDFTSDRNLLRKAILSTRPGEGTKFYDAVEWALNSIRKIKGRKALVVFTDGVDWHSDRATYDGTLRWIDEEGVIVYPIRFDTRVDTERQARQQAEQSSPTLPTLDVIRRSPGGTTPTTFPGEDGSVGPPSLPRPTSGPLGLPTPSEIMRRTRDEQRRNDPNRVPDDMSLPPDDTTGSRTSLPPTGSTSRRGRSREEDSITKMLDLAYLTADGYLETLATKTGGKLLRADTVELLPDAFSKIAAELRTQYVLGYYPINKTRDDKYRKIKVVTSRKGAVLRSRPGYLAGVAR